MAATFIQMTHIIKLKILLSAFVSLITPFVVTAQTDCEFQIDSAKILMNKNLDNFISKIRNDSFNISYDKQDIPLFLKKQLDCLALGFSIANPYEEYQASDNIKIGLPKRQLIFLAESKDLLVMTYFTGGLSHWTHMLFIKFEKEKILDLWTGVCHDILQSKNDILNFLKKNKNKNLGFNGNWIYL